MSKVRKSWDSTQVWVQRLNPYPQCCRRPGTGRGQTSTNLKHLGIWHCRSDPSPWPPSPRAHLPLGQRTWALMGPRSCGNQYFFSPKAQLWEAHSRCFMRWDAWHPSTMGGAHGRCSASTQVWNGAGHTVGPQETPPGAQALLCVHPCADGLGLAHLGLTPSMPHVTSSKNLSLPRPQFPHL